MCLWFNYVIVIFSSSQALFSLCVSVKAISFIRSTGVHSVHHILTGTEPKSSRRHLLLHLGWGRWGSRLSRDTQTSLSPYTSPSSSGGAQGVPRPSKRHSPSSVSWAVPWASSRWDMSGAPPEEGIQVTSGIDARATSTGSSRCGGAAALL
ncbi:hypothetical protein ILYODFUR_007528 [Ilyodon furcidens]|uniref:Secreted protein n=1 Tax=Ilyodon furcidens TaxID=33524 RepID=A0ABV0SV00_9TELE